jgi:hypothetical protein
MSFHLYDIEFGLCYYCEFWSSIRGEGRSCGLSMGWNGGDGWILSGGVICHARIC